MLSRLKLRFVVATVSIAMVLLSIVMAAIIVLTAFEVRIEIRNKLNKSLDYAETVHFPLFGNFDGEDCIVFAYVNETYYASQNDNYTEEEKNELVSFMLSSKKNTFDFQGRQYFFAVREIKNNVVLYSIYDASAEMIMLNHSWRIAVATFIAGLVVIALIAWGLSAAFLQPVSDAFEKQKDLIANASHELKTPLTIIETDLTLAKDGIPADDPSQKWLEAIEGQTKRMNTLIKEMLELSRLESTAIIKSELVKVGELFESMLLELEAGCFEKNITLESSIQPDIEIISDEEKIKKLFSILLNNAYKYTPNGGEISVVMTSKKNSLQFSITNSGQGIPQEKVSHVFERFYKVDESRSEDDNSFGLGLAIAKSIIDSLGGWIKCDSSENEYTTFKVSIPTRKE